MLRDLVYVLLLVAMFVCGCLTGYSVGYSHTDVMVASQAQLDYYQINCDMEVKTIDVCMKNLARYDLMLSAMSDGYEKLTGDIPPPMSRPVT